MPAITEIQPFDILMKEYENGEEILRVKLKVSLEELFDAFVGSF